MRTRLHPSSRRDVHKASRSGILKLMPAAGGPARELFRARGIDAPRWMPRSQHLVFARVTSRSIDELLQGGGGVREGELWRISADGGKPEKVGRARIANMYEDLRVHRDGQRIAFTRRSSPGGEKERSLGDGELPAGGRCIYGRQIEKAPGNE